jgi:hypothetical protein
MRLPVVITILFLFAAAASADDSRPSSQKAMRQEKRDERESAKREPDSTKRETLVKAFVTENHPELVDVLEHLRDHKAKQYDKAIRELFTTSTKLASLKQSDPALHELELKAWKLKSRIQLLAARLSMGASDELKDELKSLITEQYDNRREILLHQRELAEKRATRLDKEITEHESRRDAAIAKQFESMVSGGRPKADKRAVEKKSTQSTVSP